MGGLIHPLLHEDNTAYTIVKILEATVLLDRNGYRIYVDI